MIKKSELVTIEDRTPYLATASWVSVLGVFNESPRLIHIISRIGKTEDGSRHDLTNCGRVFEYPERLRNSDLESFGGEWFSARYKLCSRCGTLEDFERVRAVMEDVARKYRIERESEEARREAAYQWAKTWRGVEDMILEEARAHPDELITVRVGDILDLLDEMKGGR